MVIAHTKNDKGQRQDLADHLHAVARAAATFATPFEGGVMAYRAGLLHDIGKFNPAFQQYLIEAEANPKTHQRGPDHKGAGALLAKQIGDDLLTFLVSGHHGGLFALNGSDKTKKGLREWLRERATDTEVSAAIVTARSALSELAHPARIALPEYVRDQITQEFFVRMLFSALVDADFLDTERHFSTGKAAIRGESCSLADLEILFAANQQAKMDHAEHVAPGDLVNAIRRDVYQWCLAASELHPGFFRLSVPTGGGKTRSSLGFALRHAAMHGQRRIIYAIPYTSITEQTADEFRAIFAECGHGTVPLEHHSAVAPTDPDAPTPSEVSARLAAENWDVPLVVTTTVQLFESLMACSTSACRKLHNIAGSVVILDEVQSLPAELLTPILDVLRQLVAHYGVTVVLCTATQPALDTDQATGFTGLPDVREIVPDPAGLFAGLARVEYRLPSPGEQWSWERVAEALRAEQQALAIVNTRAHAVALLDTLGDPDALHLSTWMCGAHRRDVLAEVRRRLAAHEPCRLISTQVIEAGVDVDFPLVLRAMGPLDSIVQAAGRCNRNGRLSTGQVIVFIPEEAALPHGPYRIGTEVASQELARATIDLHDPATYRRYFRRFYDQIDLDAKKIQPSREKMDYPKVAADFQMIADDTVPVVVTQYEKGEHAGKAEAILKLLRQEPWRARLHMRTLQPYIVAIRQHQIKRIVERGGAEEIVEMPGLYVWHGQYDPVHGIDIDGYRDAASDIW